MNASVKRLMALLLSLFMFLTHAIAEETPEQEQPEPPGIIQEALRIAFEEREALGGGTLSRSNKYTRWYCGKPCEFGWCGGFVSYCLDMAGVPMEYWADTEEHPEAMVYAVREAGVGKLLTGYTRLNRLTSVPRPGYLVIYAVRKSSNKTVHVGMVTSVERLEDGRYVLCTIEGNMSSRIKEYCFIFDPAPEKDTYNLLTLPKEQWTDERYQYEPHPDTWYINTFCATWVTEDELGL